MNVNLPAVIGLMGVGRMSSNGPGLTISLLLVLVAESFEKEIDDTAKRLEQKGEP